MDESVNLPQPQSELATLATAFDKLQEHVVITNEKGTIVYANKAVESTTGYSIPEMLGKKPGELWGGKMPKEFYATLWRCISIDKKPFVGEVKNIRKDGTEYWQELHITPILTENGTIRFFIAIEPDITERKKKEEYREEFFSIARHQIMNPLTKNNIIIDLLLSQEGLAKDKEKIMQLYKGNLGIMNLINDLIFLSRPKNEHHFTENIDLSIKIEETINRVKDSNPGVTFTFNKEGTSFIINTNNLLAEQVFYNIIANAAEYSSPNLGMVDLKLKEAENEYLFTCGDNGIGIPLDDQADIFHKFFRASNAAEAKSEGTGLGMYIVKTICDELGWKVSFVSEEKKGTTFTLSIVKTH